MIWLSLHKESQQFATRAQIALRKHYDSQALKLYKKAARIEQKAFNIIDISKVRTRGIIAVSTVALWYKAKEYDKALQFAQKIIKIKSLPAFAIRNIVKIMRGILKKSFCIRKVSI